MKLVVHNSGRHRSSCCCCHKNEARRPLSVRRKCPSFHSMLFSNIGTVIFGVGTLGLIWVSHRSSTEVSSSDTLFSSFDTASSTPPYSILHLPELTTWLIGNFTAEATHFYHHHALNEEQGELWLHRGFLRLQDRREIAAVPNPHQKEEDKHSVIIICAYLHFNQYLYKKRPPRRRPGLSSQQQIIEGPPYSTDAWMRILQDRVEQAVTAHPAERVTFVLAVPTWNPTRGNEIGLSKVSQLFYRHVIPQPARRNHTIRYVSLGYERNVHWQKVASPHDIVPIPYVVNVTQATEHPSTTEERILNSVFYVGDTRPHAVRWSGCNRTALLQPLQDYYHSTTARDTRPSIDVRLLSRKEPRLSMDEYHCRMAQSHYCLIVCGDTPTSRSLASAMVHGCTPLFIGMERWYGYCEEPCRAGWGWTVLHQNNIGPGAPESRLAAISHFPFGSVIDYHGQFPSVKEAEWIQNPVQALQGVLQRQSLLESPSRLPEEMASMFLYGWGDPVTTEHFGRAVPSIWDSFVRTMI